MAEWIKTKETVYGFDIGVNKCSACGGVTPVSVDRYAFCPRCGARMYNVELSTGIFDEEEVHHNCLVQIWRNSETGEESIGWKPEEPDEEPM